MTTAAAIDRLVHHATVLELKAESYRIAHAKGTKNEKNSTQKNSKEEKITEKPQEKMQVK